MTNDLLLSWCQAVTIGDSVAARAALKAGADKLVKLEKMDNKESEMFQRVSRDVELQLVVLSKSKDGFNLGYVLDGSRTRTGANLSSIGFCKSSITAKPGDVIKASVETVRPILEAGKYGVTASGVKVLFKASGAISTSREIYQAGLSNGSLVCEPAMMQAIEKFNLTHSMGYKSKNVSRETKIYKADEEKHLMYCVILEPSGDDGEPIERDADGQWFSREAVEDAAHWFMAYGSLHNVNLDHKDPLDSDAIKMVESYIERVGDANVKPGSWVGCWFIGDPAIWEAYKSGELTGVSIQGDGVIRPG